MKRIAVALVVVTSVLSGCAAMGTKRSTGASIQRTADPVDYSGQVDGQRPELGQR